MDEVEGWWITANVRRVPMSACRVEDRFFNLCGELCIMENEMKIHSQLDETKLKLDSSSLYNEVDPTGPAPARSVSERSLCRGIRESRRGSSTLHLPACSYSGARRSGRDSIYNRTDSYGSLSALSFF